MSGGGDNSKVLVLLISALSFVSVCLIVVNVFVFINGGSHNYSINCNENDEGLLSCLRSAYKERYDANDYTSAYSVYQDFIEKENDDEKKSQLVIYRLKDLNNSCSYNCKEDILKDVKTLSLMSEDYTRANLMCSYEGMYGDKETASEYCELAAKLSEEKRSEYKGVKVDGQ